MKVTLAIVVVVSACALANAASWGQSPQQSAPAVQAPPPTTGQNSPQQQETPPPGLTPCAKSNDTCEVEPLPQPPATIPPAKAEQPTPEAKPSPKPATHRKKSHRQKSAKQQVAAPDPSAPKKIVVRHGSTSDPTAVLTPGGTIPGNSTPQMTADLLSATDANLKEAASKPLTATQEETVDQIKLFMEQANAAVKAGDLDRGHNLAIKAHLLSDDLVKH